MTSVDSNLGARALARLRQAAATGVRTASALDDLDCLGSGCVFERTAQGGPSDRLDYLWFHVRERPAPGQAWEGYRVIKLSELSYLPQEARADPALIRKQASVNRGLYAAGVELVTLHYGVFDPPLGIVQCYGAAARRRSLPEAASAAAEGHAAVTASLTAQYPQCRLVPLAGDRVRWLWEALQRMPFATSLVGQPDPREGARGGGREGRAEAGGQPPVFSEQQNELLFRALARAREEFLFLNIATPISRDDLGSMLMSLADLVSPIASRQQGASVIGFGLSLPVILNLGQGQSAGQSYGTSQVQGASQTAGASRGSAHTEGQAQSSSWSHGTSRTETQGAAETDSTSHTVGLTQTTSSAHGTSESTSVGRAESQSQTTGQSHTAGSFSSVSAGGSHSESAGGSHTLTDPAGMGSSVVDLAPLGLGIKLGYSDNITGPTVSDGSSWGVSNGSSWGSSSGVSESTTTSQAVTTGQSLSQSHSLGTSESSGQSLSQSESTSTGHALTHSQAVSQGVSDSVGGSTAHSSADTLSQSQSLSVGRSQASGLSSGQSLGASQTQALGAGAAPSASVSKSFQWKDEAAAALTQLLEQQLGILREATEEGGFYSDVYLLCGTEAGRRIAEAAAVQAFGGSQGVVTHLQPRRPQNEAEARHLLQHVRAFTPSTLTESLGWINGYAYSSVITPTQQAAYSAPGLFEEGTALTVQERIPPFAFRPDMRGEADLGFLYSTERGELTRARVRLPESRHFHTLFAADTGFGKTVAAERLAVEAVRCWQHRVVVLDFGAGWRRLLSGPLPAGRTDLYQLFPGAPRPFRWNFLQIGRRIDPNRQYAATAELLANAGRMGPRQLGYIKQALWDLYVEAGALTAESAVCASPAWGRVRPDEAAVLAAAAAARGLPEPASRTGTPLGELSGFERQALAVHRSTAVTAAGLHARLLKRAAALGKDPTARTSLEGVLLRLEPFTHGELAQTYSGPGPGVAIEDLGLLGTETRHEERWGLCVLEGGAEMDEYAKAVILSLAAWHLYTDSVVRRREMIGRRPRTLDIFFEEANKILNGAVGTDGSDRAAGGSAAALWQQMWRDGRKYGIFLHPIAQTLSDLPSGIQSSCNNAFFGQLKNPLDRDLAISHLARSERGFTDEEYKRFISRMPAKLAILKLGYSDDVADMEPMLCRPARVPGREPADSEIPELPRAA